MSSELSEKLLDVLLNISESIKPIPFWQNFSFWNVVILAFTLYWVWRYACATKQMAIYQIIPAIDVNMCYNINSKKTYFWFSNTSNLPGMVSLRHKKNDETIKDTYIPLRVPPKRNMRTADADFGLSPLEGDKITLYVAITPAIDNQKDKIEFEKSYNFSENQWNEISWSFPDPPFPS